MSESLQERIVRLLGEALGAAEAGELRDAIATASVARMDWEDAGSPDDAEDSQ